LAPADLARVTPDWASQVRWLDWLVLNPDRTPENPNILVTGTQCWLIDHGAALPFQHDWAAVTEQMPQRHELSRAHLFDAAATRLQEWDPLLTSLLTRERLTEAVAAVPDSFLAPLVGPSPASIGVTRRRAAYVAFLWKRLQGEHHFRTAGSRGPG
jgi:hypothetical protein